MGGYVGYVRLRRTQAGMGILRVLKDCPFVKGQNRMGGVAAFFGGHWMVILVAQEFVQAQVLHSQKER